MLTDCTILTADGESRKLKNTPKKRAQDKAKSGFKALEKQLENNAFTMTKYISVAAAKAEAKEESESKQKNKESEKETKNPDPQVEAENLAAAKLDAYNELKAALLSAENDLMDAEAKAKLKSRTVGTLNNIQALETKNKKLTDTNKVLRKQAKDYTNIHQQLTDLKVKSKSDSDELLQVKAIAKTREKIIDDQNIQLDTLKADDVNSLNSKVVDLLQVTQNNKSVITDQKTIITKLTAIVDDIKTSLKGKKTVTTGVINKAIKQVR